MFQANWFVAWMVLDQRRKESNRNAFCPCKKHDKSPQQEASTNCLKVK
jgi:hypothetical protein